MPLPPAQPNARPHTYGRQLTVGDRLPLHTLKKLDGSGVEVPDGRGLVHLQLRRFAGCPVCNLHLRSVVQRREDIEREGIHEVVVFHSTIEELRQYAADLPLDVIADPDRDLYRELGVERSLRAVLNPRLWPRFPKVVAGAWRNARCGRGLPPVRPTGGQLGLPADVLLSADGRVLASKYGDHAYDQWSVDELLEQARASAEA